MIVLYISCYVYCAIYIVYKYLVLLEQAVIHLDALLAAPLPVVQLGCQLQGRLHQVCWGSAGVEQRLKQRQALHA